MRYRITADIGGTFSDVVAGDEHGRAVIGKAPTTPDRAFDGINSALEVIAEQLGTSVRDLLGATDLFIYSTTRATNAIIEKATARTAFLTTEGFPDTLVLREGGKLDPFDVSVEFPDPYIPRRLTFEIRERVSSEGNVATALDVAHARTVLDELAARDVQAIAVCLLWSVANPVHELRLGELIEARLPDVPYTLSHQLNPVIREYRRASATAIDASLKPLMGSHLQEVIGDLGEAGFAGELMAATSFGGVMPLDDLSRRPINSVRSGPALAPVAGHHYAATERGAADAIVCDTGGTSFDVSLIRDGAISFTRDTWLGPKFTGDLLGSSAVDVRSIGAGGGSIAWIDTGGMLHVGPESAGAQPGPACYGRGGITPTVTDAALVLGYLDAASFLGGRMALDVDAARSVCERLGDEMGGLSLEIAAASVLTVANEHMVQAIQEMTVSEGVDPRESVIVAGGGAAGLGIVSIARELGCRRLIMPRTAGALSATGGYLSDIVAEFSRSAFADTGSFDFELVNETLAALDDRVDHFLAGLRERGYGEHETTRFAEARYASQVWELEVPVPAPRFSDAAHVAQFRNAFDAVHERIFAISEPASRVEVLGWKTRVRVPVGAERISLDGAASWRNGGGESTPTRRAYFPPDGWMETPAVTGGELAASTRLSGPAIVEEPTSTLVLPPGTSLEVTAGGNYLVEVTP